MGRAASRTVCRCRCSQVQRVAHASILSRSKRWHGRGNLPARINCIAMSTMAVTTMLTRESRISAMSLLRTEELHHCCSGCCWHRCHQRSCGVRGRCSCCLADSFLLVAHNSAAVRVVVDRVHISIFCVEASMCPRVLPQWVCEVAPRKSQICCANFTGTRVRDCFIATWAFVAAKGTKDIFCWNCLDSRSRQQHSGNTCKHYKSGTEAQG